MADMIGKGFTHTDTQVDAIGSRLSSIEYLLLEEQQRKIEDLEQRMKRLEDALAVWLYEKSPQGMVACLAGTVRGFTGTGAPDAWA